MTSGLNSFSIIRYPANGGEKLGKQIVFITALLTIITLCSVSPALTGNANASNVEIYYYTGANMSTNRNFPSTGSPIGNLLLTFSHAMNKDDTTGNTMFIAINSSKGNVPVGFITSNPDVIPTIHATLTNTSVYINRSGQVKDNVKLVSGEELKVMRQGNRISVDFNPSNTITLIYNIFPDWPAPHPGFPLTLPLVVPAFHVEFSKNGGSVHTNVTTVLKAGPPLYLSGYTAIDERVGFRANSDFTCAAWGNPGTSDGWITMHGIETWIPPE